MSFCNSLCVQQYSASSTVRFCVYKSAQSNMYLFLRTCLLCGLQARSEALFQPIYSILILSRMQIENENNLSFPSGFCVMFFSGRYTPSLLKHTKTLRTQRHEWRKEQYCKTKKKHIILHTETTQRKITDNF